MKKINFEQLETTEAGCTTSQIRAIAIIGGVATVGSFFGPIGAVIFGPTSVGMSIAGIYCAYKTE